MDLIQGARNQEEQDKILARLAPHAVVHLEIGDSRAASAWFAAYWLGHKVGILDCLIAAIAVRIGAPLYTFNTAHFQAIPGLDVRSHMTGRSKWGPTVTGCPWRGVNPKV